MKGTIIGTDLLEFNNSVKILEINTNATIFNSAVDLLDYTSFFEMLVNKLKSKLQDLLR
jgi:glutathione synthase/RimK-type ligase-like ATP-grasp enzyme